LAGALAGALHGLSDIPQAMLEALPRRELLDSYLARILEHRARAAAAMNAVPRGS
jgi:ADP-ribosylglycohydrolase